MVISIFLYLLCIVIIFTRPNVSELYLAIVLASTNIYFCYSAAIGFFQIGLLGLNPLTGSATVTAYEDMNSFYMIFFGLVMVNAGIIVFSILNIIRLKSEEMLEANHKKRWRDGY